MIQRYKAAVSLAACLIALPGCHNLDAVEDFAVVASKTVSRFPAMMQDNRRSLIQQKRIDLLVNGNRPLGAASAQAEASCASTGPCAALDELTAASGIFETYVKVMGQLAAGDRARFDHDVGALNNNAQKAFDIKSSDKEALNGLSTFLLNIVGRSIQEKALAAAVNRNQANVKTVLAGLRLAVVNYRTVLTNEKTQLDALTGIARQQSTDPLAQLVSAYYYGSQSGILDRKLHATADYLACLDIVDEAFTKLTQAPAWNSRPVLKRLREDAQTLQPLISRVVEAYP